MSIVDRIKGQGMNVIEYIDTQHLSFEEKPLDEIDSLIFSLISYLKLDKIVGMESEEWIPLSQIHKEEDQEYLLTNTFYPSKSQELIHAIGTNPRYQNVTMNYHTEKLDKDTEEQFSAITFQLPTGELLIVYRGTDTAVVGWKEDMNMTFLSPVPSQLSAVEYLEFVASKTEAPMYLMGHSKGGNLAIYSSAFCEKEIHNRIQRIYSLDGPGFSSGTLDSIYHKDIIDKVVNYIPEQSIIGLFLDSVGEVNFINSNRIAMLQHNGFMWVIDENGFEPSEKSRYSRQIDESFNLWIDELNIEQRKLFVDTLFSVIDVSKAENVTDLTRYMIKEYEAIWDKIKEIDEETSACIRKMLKRLVKLNVSIYKGEMPDRTNG